MDECLASQLFQRPHLSQGFTNLEGLTVDVESDTKMLPTAGMIARAAPSDSCITMTFDGEHVSGRDKYGGSKLCGHLR